jgi:uncharacterized membrane protein YkoI
MNKRNWLTGLGVAIAVAGVGGVISAAATGGDDDAGERPITGSELEQAKAAALEHTGGGTVTGTEVDDEESKYEVEVRLDSGKHVDVQLDEGFTVVGQEGDGAGEDG